VSHVAFFSFPAYAHVAPTLPVAAELVRRGHRVTFSVADRFADRVAATGAEVLGYESTFPWASGPDDGDGPDRALRLMLNFLAEGIAPLDSAARRFADDRPDLFVHDLAGSETARLLARKWDRPIAQTCPTFATNEIFRMNDAQAATSSVPSPPVDLEHPDLLAFVRRSRELLARHDLSTVDINGFGGDFGPNLVFLPQQFQVQGETFGDRYRFIGPCFDEAADGGTWTPPASGLPVVLISLGTSHSAGQAEFFRTCVRALAGQPWHVVLTLGTWVPPAELGSLPDNVEAHPFVPHPAVLRHARVFVTHAGMGSVMESLFYDVPMVAVPHHIDQRVIAGQIEDLGLGRTVARAGLTEQHLRTVVGQVATDELIRVRVSRMRQHVRTAGGAAGGADAVESWLDNGISRPAERKAVD
jgi:calicheamicin 4-deoxy-4-thio-alpha-D-digitoxosyltransferase